MKILRKLTYYLIGLIFLSLILFISFPKIVSKTFGKKIFQSILSQKLDGQLKIGSLDLSWRGPQKVRSVTFVSNHSDFSFAELKADLPLWSLFSINKNFFSSIDGSFEIKEGSIAFFGEGVSSRLENIFVTAYSTSNNTVELSINGVSKTNNESGNFSIRAILKDQESFPQFLQVQLIDFPSIGIDQLIQATKLRKILKKERLFFSNLLGRMTNFSLLIEDSAVDFDLNATLMNVRFAASRFSNSLVLTQPLYANFRLPPRTGRKDKDALDIRSLTPANLYISEQNSFLPIPFSIDRLSIGYATLDMGQIEVRDSETLNSIIRLTNSSPPRGVKIWFTPVNFNIQNNILETDRMDMLLDNSIHLATWGDINLKTERLDMSLGLPADTLENFFHIPSLPKNYVMQVPVRGTISKPKIDSKAILAKVASLAIASQASQALPGLGEFFQMIDSEKAPPPAKEPFPWEGQLQPKPQFPSIFGR